MRDIFISFLILTLCVAMHLANDISTKQKFRKYNNYNNIIEKSISDAGKIENFTKIALNLPCYGPHLDCYNKLNGSTPEPTCVHNKKLGLVNYRNVCQINLQLCLIKKQSDPNTMTPMMYTEDDEIYYNGKELNCYFYLKGLNTMDEAISFYYKVGLENYNGGTK